jgi:hypothetical protein
MSPSSSASSAPGSSAYFLLAEVQELANDESEEVKRWETTALTQAPTPLLYFYYSLQASKSNSTVVVVLVVAGGAVFAVYPNLRMPRRDAG